MIAGHWMPDVVSLAGGQAVLARPGMPSQYIAWEDLQAVDPDVIAVVPCGFSLWQTKRELSFLTERDGWANLRAVRRGRVYLFDGNAYFNRPGPRLYRAVELLAAVLHPASASALEVADWEMMHGP
jgi:iron complex transport system substrate-binding protein